jgi:hypothetical protein
MDKHEIVAGTEVVITDVLGRTAHTVALGPVETAGHGFPVVWVRRPLTNGGTDEVPWPATDVRPVDRVHA